MDAEIKRKVIEAIEDLPSAVKKGYIHPNYRHTDPLLPEPMIATMISAEAYAQGALTFKASFPDFRSELVWLVADENKSAARWLWSGTFTGQPFDGQKPNGRLVTFEGLTMWNWKDGQVVEGITLYDITGFRRQLQA